MSEPLLPRVIALAGRRIDAPEASIGRFPLSSVELVRSRLSKLLPNKPSTVLVSSAACGADLIALDLALSRGFRCRIILPFSPSRFRETSVTDRPGDWGEIFDLAVRKVEQEGDLVVLSYDGEDNKGYAAVNRRIIEEARSFAAETGGEKEALAVIVWDGKTRGKEDASEQFLRLAQREGISIVEVSTLA